MTPLSMKQGIEIDIYDTQIIRLLSQDARIAFSAIADELKISNTMVHQRVNKLIKNGVITGFEPVLDEKKLGYEWGSFTGITLEKDGDSDRVIEALKKIPEITECYFITGGFTLYLRILAKSHAHMREILYEKIDAIPGIQKTDSIMELGCAFKRNVGLG